MEKSLLDFAKVRIALEEHFYNEYLKEPECNELWDLFAEFVENEDTEEKYNKNYDIVANAVAKIREEAFREGFYNALELFTND